MIYLTRLKVIRFRDVTPGTELHFSDGWNVVLGRNATGKTTLLHLISMALRGDFDELRDEAFWIEYDVEGAIWNATVSLSHDFAKAQQTALPGFDLSEYRVPIDRCSLYVTVDLQKGLDDPDERQVEPHDYVISTDPRVSGDEIPITAPTLPDRFALQVGRYVEFAETDADEGLDAFASDMATMRSYRFDEALGLFRRVHQEPDDNVGGPRNMLATVTERDGRTRLNISLTPAAITTTFDRTEQGLTSVRASFEKCPQLSAATRHLGGTSLTATWPVEKSERIGSQTLTTLGAPTILLHRADGSAVSVKRLSFGQRRLFTFAWYLDSNPGAVVADELVNGMHYEWIEDCVRAMEGRQVFVTAQNPLLLDHMGFASPHDVTQTFVLCRAEHDATNTRSVVWAHPTEEQSQEFFRAYENGILRVHEILRTEGLW